MTRKLRVGVVTLFMVMATGTAAFATSGAHFFSVSSSVADNGALVVSYDEAGVGNQTVNYNLAYNYVFDWGCLNGGGNHPKASNKQTTSGAASTTFSENPDNGRVHATFSTAAPQMPNFSCPSGQILVLADASYTGIVLADITNSVSTSVPDASRIYFPFK